MIVNNLYENQWSAGAESWLFHILRYSCRLPPQCLPFSCRIYNLFFFSFFSFLLQPHATGQYRIQDLDKVMFTLNKQFGKIAKVGGLIGHPDLLFVFDGDEIRKIFKKEETLPHRCRTNNLRSHCSRLINLIRTNRISAHFISFD